MSALVFELVLRGLSAVGLIALVALVWKAGVILQSFRDLRDSVTKMQSREEQRDAAVKQLATDVARIAAIVDGVEKRVELLEHDRRRG